MRRLALCFAAIGAVAMMPSLAPGAPARGLSIPIYAVDAGGIGVRLGTVEARDTPEGLQLKIDVKNLPPGLHGFHVHTVPNCGPAQIGGRLVPAGAAGGPYDPFRAGHHAGPTGNGYLGDLPVLAVGSDGVAQRRVMAWRLKLDDIHNRSLLIKAAGDNYSDTPEPMGGGGDAIACGIIR